MRITKELLLAENKSLKNENDSLRDRIRKLKQDFTNVLRGRDMPPIWSSQYSSNNPLSWEEIFFKIGELNSDANYTILLEENRKLQEKIAELKKELPHA